MNICKVLKIVSSKVSEREFIEKNKKYMVFLSLPVSFT